MCAYTDILGFMFDFQSKFNLILACPISLSHRYGGNMSLILHMPVIKCAFHVCISCSVAFHLCMFKGIFFTFNPASSTCVFIFPKHSLSIMVIFWFDTSCLYQLVKLFKYLNKFLLCYIFNGYTFAVIGL